MVNTYSILFLHAIKYYPNIVPWLRLLLRDLNFCKFFMKLILMMLYNI